MDIKEKCLEFLIPEKIGDGPQDEQHRADGRDHEGRCIKFRVDNILQ